MSPLEVEQIEVVKCSIFCDTGYISELTHLHVTHRVFEETCAAFETVVFTCLN
jgi:hypothetical protein